MLLCKPEEDCDPDEDELEMMKAAAGALAILSSNSRVVCGKILTCSNSIEILLWLVANPLVDLQLRGVAIVGNIIEQDQELAEQLFGSPIFEVRKNFAIKCH